MKTTVKSFLLSIFLCIGVSAFSQDIVEKEYDFRDFSKLNISGTFSVTVTQGSNYKITILYPEGMQDHFRCNVDDGELNLGVKSWKNANGYPKAVVQMPELKRVELSGASSISITEFQGEEIKIDISGASSLSGNLNYSSFKIESSGASDSKLEGKVDNAKISLSGASEITGKTFTVDGELVLNCSGASSLTLTANGDVFAKLGGASSFDFYGQGTLIKPETSGSSNIHKKD